MEPYLPDIDYCGPNRHWVSRFISNKPWGGNINFCCFQHDAAYERGGTGEDRALADERMRECISKRLAAKWWIPRFLAEMVAFRYYTAVRVFGSARFNYHPGQTQA